MAVGLAGDDNLQVPNVLLGGAGDDLITGGGGRDLVIGGTGADQVVGNGGDDLMIGGTTAFDANDPAPQAIDAEWTSGHDFATRIANPNVDSSKPGYGGRLNGGYFLIPQQTLLADGAVDSLAGSPGSGPMQCGIGGTARFTSTVRSAKLLTHSCHSQMSRRERSATRSGASYRLHLPLNGSVRGLP
jgi:hypothetical protein